MEGARRPTTSTLLELFRPVGGWLRESLQWQILFHTQASQQQHEVANSSSEAEFRAYNLCDREGLFLRKLLAEFSDRTHDCGSNVMPPTTIYSDNETCVKWLRNKCHHEKTKHIDCATLYVDLRASDGLQDTRRQGRSDGTPSRRRYEQAPCEKSIGSTPTFFSDYLIMQQAARTGGRVTCVKAAHCQHPRRTDKSTRLLTVDIRPGLVAVKLPNASLEIFCRQNLSAEFVCQDFLCRQTLSAETADKLCL